MAKEKIVEQEVNGCRLVMIFPDKPVEGTLERIQGVISGACEERIEKELAGGVYRGMSA